MALALAALALHLPAQPARLHVPHLKERPVVAERGPLARLGAEPLRREVAQRHRVALVGAQDHLADLLGEPLKQRVILAAREVDAGEALPRVPDQGPLRRLRRREGVDRPVALTQRGGDLADQVTGLRVLHHEGGRAPLPLGDHPRAVCGDGEGPVAGLRVAAQHRPTAAGGRVPDPHGGVAVGGRGELPVGGEARVVRVAGVTRPVLRVEV